MNITAVDINNIEKAIQAGGDIWNNKLVSDFKTRIKRYYRGIENEQCCYCKKNFGGEFSMVIDIEHILPKGHPEFRDLMFVLSNLNIACKRCNMQIKRTRTDFVKDISEVAKDHGNSKLYKLIHPNFDKYFDHINVSQQIDNDKKLIKYKIVSDSKKGQYTFDFFRLNELEIDSINEAQGVDKKTELSNKIDVKIQERLRKAFKKL